VEETKVTRKNSIQEELLSQIIQINSGEKIFNITVEWKLVSENENITMQQPHKMKFEKLHILDDLRRAGENI
jgi:hypothetical protein